MTIGPVLLDANVLYPAPMRDLFLQLAVLGACQPRWSDTIHDEWISALLRNEPWRDPQALQRTRFLMDNAVRDCLITDFGSVVSQLHLPDPNDRHVLAAAIVGDCETIVTRNARDFPQEVLLQYDLAIRDPDDVLHQTLLTNERMFIKAITIIQSRLVNPPVSIDDYLNTLDQQGLPTTVSALRPLTPLP